MQSVEVLWIGWCWWPATYDALLFQGYDTVFHPYAPAAHPVCEQHVGKQPVPNNSDVMRLSDSCVWVLAEVVHDLVPTAGLLHSVREDSDAGGLLYFCG